MTDTSPEAVERHTELMMRYNLIDAVKCMDAQAARIAELEAQKWEVQHTDTMNTLVQMGMARDEAIARAERAEAEVARLRDANAALRAGNDLLLSHAMREKPHD